ncbi:MAG: ATP-binding protein [Ruminococcus sp.]|nr:ATP-binding protein [Ruminococcus sp.]
MAKVILICGKICSGKSTYAEQLRIKERAAVLSVDEIMLALFEQQVGDKHEEYTQNIQKYLFEKSAELVETGINVILEWGFWTKASRKFAKQFYEDRNIACEMHYLDISDEVWEQRLMHRNQLVLEGKTSAYFVDDNLAKKFDSIFEMPAKDEIDLWVTG